MTFILLNTDNIIPSSMAINTNIIVLIFKPSKSVATITIKNTTNKAMVSALCCELLTSVLIKLYAVFIIIIDTAILIPKKALEIISICKKSLIKYYMILITIIEGNITPTVARIAPSNFPFT